MIEIVSALLEQRKEEASFMAWVQKREEKTIEKRMVIIARNRFFSLRPGGKVYNIPSIIIRIYV